MQFLFKRSKKKRESNDTVKNNTLVKYMEKGYFYVQSKWAEWMAKQASKLSVRKQLLVFGFFMACTGGYSVFLISMSFSDTNSTRITVTPIVKAVKTFQTDIETINKSSAISKIELDEIIRFRAYIDSLALSSAGKRVLDSIRNKHPGLLDSLAEIENYYQSNLKNDNYGK